LAQWEQFGKEGIKKKKEKREKNERKGLTLTGLLMEGVDSDNDDRIPLNQPPP
jgi:hypothetical protein